ncbi:unnamed protein product [Effrenium voratum]|uniref:MI domain-containing protein n=1 Tax=Effrenium voratum TaxID=2562239 RepID=A0AA36J757_9DINO|nr:unnamed protein product [Effrenium voratum]CAJ1400421.1 unnamed protein product [Effrenium voratum]|mmetsp:Transcript_125261/g.297277  ORF Transcript_125261/g.297277 Transcript_125261/m.297277 type:complete len:495 (+) Transcript_125261:77-1561(+)|eukprot:CAMPEP_0181435524 /NCGR_PEP_ID=MMETSP1110-20121109/20378_1 /TAXON_ID=174948 /ORGANISM="Symbiodinium sp., Strain CCMP421" /LENGTH=494 /DNA_ID=CAMNT_0023559063 /DNA_START=75 /DNA_END=1559 /DNA_ORIENTATION=-
MASGYGGGVMTVPQHDSLPMVEGCGKAREQQPPARTRMSSFGDDNDLAEELPPNWSLRRFQEKAKSVLLEYYVSLALDDTVLSAQELLAACPSQADELGVVAIQVALDQGKDASTAVVKLFDALSRSKSLDRSALIRSFEEIFCTLEDLKIDAPYAEKGILEILQGCIEVGCIEMKLLTKLPETLLRAGLACEEGLLSGDFRDMLSKTVSELKGFKQAAQRCIEEYYVSLNAEEVGTVLRELNMKPYHHEFVKKAVIMSFSQPTELAGREAVLTLLTALSREAGLSKDDIQWGTTRLLGSVSDLSLDYPRCSEMLTEVIIRLLTDELVSVPFLRRCRLLRIGDGAGLKVLEAVQRRTPEYSKKQLSTAAFKREIKEMILEYFDSGDHEEFGRCIRELTPLSSEQSAELVRKTMVFAMERTAAECELSLKLLIWISRNEELSGQEIENGFDDMYRHMPDILLDVPDAEEMARSFVVEAMKNKVLRESWPDPEEPE